MNSKILELASNLAHNAMVDELKETFTEEEMYTTDGGDNSVYTDYVQDVFNRHYDYFDTEIRKVLLTKRIQLLSPDGFTFDREGKTYKTIEAAKKALKRFSMSWEQQGYYSTIREGRRVRIPLDEVINYCQFNEVYE